MKNYYLSSTETCLDLSVLYSDFVRAKGMIITCPILAWMYRFLTVVFYPYPYPDAVKCLRIFFLYVLRFRLAFKSINITINLNKYYILCSIIVLNCGFSIVRSAFHYDKTLNLFQKYK